MKKACVLYLISVAITIMSCSSIDTVKGEQLIVTGIKSRNLEKVPFKCSWVAQQVNINDTIDLSNYVISISTNFELSFKSRISITSVLGLYSGEKLYYSDEAVGDEIKVTDVEVFTLDNFNSKYKANDNITEAVMFEIVKNGETFCFEKESFLKEKFIIRSHQNFNIKIKETLDVPKQVVSFKIVLKFSNDLMFEDTTWPIFVRNF